MEKTLGDVVLLKNNELYRNSACILAYFSRPADINLHLPSQRSSKTSFFMKFLKPGLELYNVIMLHVLRQETCVRFYRVS